MSLRSPAVVPTSSVLSSTNFLVGRLSLHCYSEWGDSSSSRPFANHRRCDTLFRVENKLGSSQPVFVWLRACVLWELVISQNSPEGPPLTEGCQRWKTLPAFVYQHHRNTTAKMRQSSTFLETMLRNAAAKDLGPLCPARPQRSNCSRSFQALTRYTLRLSCLKNYPRRLRHARLRPRRQAQSATSTQRAPRIVCSHLTLQQPS